jgi:hypothetical protein
MDIAGVKPRQLASTVLACIAWDVARQLKVTKPVSMPLRHGEFSE